MEIKYSFVFIFIQNKRSFIFLPSFAPRTTFFVAHTSVVVYSTAFIALKMGQIIAKDNILELKNFKNRSI